MNKFPYQKDEKLTFDHICQYRHFSTAILGQLRFFLKF